LTSLLAVADMPAGRGERREPQRMMIAYHAMVWELLVSSQSPAYARRKYIPTARTMAGVSSADLQPLLCVTLVSIPSVANAGQTEGKQRQGGGFRYTANKRFISVNNIQVYGATREYSRRGAFTI